jgi:hypothetical protein
MKNDNEGEKCIQRKRERERESKNILRRKRRRPLRYRERLKVREKSVIERLRKRQIKREKDASV